MNRANRQQVLLLRSGPRVCAIPIEHVVETMRPLSISPLAGTPPFVKGAAVIRGEPVPVIDLDAFLGGTAPGAVTRFAVVRSGARRAALAVDAVLGVRELAEQEVAASPLLDGACGGAVDTLRTLDEELLVVLRAGRIVPEDAWTALDGRENGA